MIRNCSRTRRSIRSCALGSACGATIVIQISRYLFYERSCRDNLFALHPWERCEGRWMEEPIDYNIQEGGVVQPLMAWIVSCQDWKRSPVSAVLTTSPNGGAFGHRFNGHHSSGIASHELRVRLGEAGVGSPGRTGLCKVVRTEKPPIYSSVPVTPRGRPLEHYDNAQRPAREV